MIVVGPVDPLLVRHLQRALSSHFRWCREQGVAVPAELRGLFDALASDGQRRPTGARSGESGDDAAMLLALTYDQAAGRLGVSSRTVRRLVAAGSLPSVMVGGLPRVRAADLAAYVEGMEVRCAGN
ncbi:MAG: helix-turn-helix domain-containing protein [Actinomycetota bacterium]|nr:helix-turn-helix domain-containing protein [Actinomycetota bacterium]